MIFNIKLILSCIYFHFKKKINSYLINLLNFYKNINLKNFLIKKFLKKEIGYFKNEKFNDFVVKNKVLAYSPLAYSYSIDDEKQIKSSKNSLCFEPRIFTKIY